MNDTFDLKRFWWTLKSTVESDLRMASSVLMGVTIGLFAMFAVITVVDHFSAIQMDGGEDAMLLEAILAAVFLVFYMGFAGFSFGFSLKSAKKRTTYLTLPASNFEKFLSCYLVSTVGMFLVFLFALLIADVGRMVLTFALGNFSFDSVFFTFFKLQSLAMENKEVVGQIFVSTNMVQIVSTAVLNIISVHAFFLCGSVLFRRHAFWMTVLAYFLISLVEGLLNIDHVGFTREMLNSDYTGAIVTSIVEIVVLYTASYLLLRRVQVIENKIISL